MGGMGGGGGGLLTYDVRPKHFLLDLRAVSQQIIIILKNGFPKHGSMEKAF